MNVKMDRWRRALRYATADGVADQAAVNRLVGLGDDYVTRNLADLRAVTPEAATAAYTSLVDGNRNRSSDDCRAATSSMVSSIEMFSRSTA